MDFFGGGGGYQFDMGSTATAVGGESKTGDFSVGAFNLGSGGDNKNMLLIGGGIALAVLLVLVLKK